MFLDESKKKHQEHEAGMEYWPGAFDEVNDDTKRHFTMLETALPIVKALQPKTILTIGDNRGRDAAYFKKMTGSHVTASDLDIKKLIPAKADGYIDDCKIIDVEKIDYQDNSIDIVVVKESFHHWPRPMIGFYETLRVAKYGVILIEPNDCFRGKSATVYPEEGSYSDQYEQVGNYLYQISLREILKACWSLFLEKVIVRGFNDPYETPFVYESWLVRKKQLDELGRDGVRQFNLITIFIEKQRDSLDLNLVEGFKIYNRPKNPYDK